MDWPALFADKALDWLWFILLALAGWIWRIEARMAANVSRLQLLEKEMKDRVENARSLHTGIDRIAAQIETHRQESTARTDDLRREIREDIRLILRAIKGNSP